MEPSWPLREPPNTSSISQRASKTIMWSSRAPQRALQQTPRTELRAPEHLQVLSSSLQGPSFELPNIWRSCQSASKERISSSQASNPGRKQANQRKTSKQTTEQASKQSNEQTSIRSNERAIKRSNEHTTIRTNKQTSNQYVSGVPRRAFNHDRTVSRSSSSSSSRSRRRSSSRRRRSSSSSSSSK